MVKRRPATAMAADVVAAALAQLMSPFSIEVTPRVAEKVDCFADHLRPGTPVYVAYVPNSSFDETVAVVRRLAHDGMRPVPHLAARTVRDERHLDDILATLSGEGGVEEILLIAGDAATPTGVFDSTIQVLRSGRLEKRGIRRVGVAGHPEGNRAIGDDGLRKALRDKNALSVSTGLPMYLVTQFCFAPGPVLTWERRIRAEGNRLPVQVGVPGLSSPKTLLQFGLSCGVGPSLRVLRRQTTGLLRVAASSQYHPDETVLGVARDVARDRASLIRAFHFFPFGAFAKTAAWANELRQGRFAIATGADRLNVTG